MSREDATVVENRKMKALNVSLWLPVVVLLATSQIVVAVPTFQVYIEGASAGDWGLDEDSWLISSSSFDLVVVGAYGANTQSLTEGTLLVSVPKGQTGAITISGTGPTPLLTLRTPASDGYFNPNADADVDVLTNESGNPAGYDAYLTKAFLPDGVTFNNHYPFQEGVSNFVLFGIGSFANLGPVNNYNADDGIISIGAGSGEEKVFSVAVEGFSWAHFDAYGYETDLLGGRKLKSTWDINPGSHDATFIPAPGAILLGGMGIVLVGWLRGRKTL